MPVLARFHGIVIRMVFSRILGPHFHAMCDGTEIVVGINPVRVLNGDASFRVRTMVMDWAEMHQQELLHAWHAMSHVHASPSLSTLN